MVTKLLIMVAIIGSLSCCTGRSMKLHDDETIAEHQAKAFNNFLKLSQAMITEQLNEAFKNLKKFIGFFKKKSFHKAISNNRLDANSTSESDDCEKWPRQSTLQDDDFASLHATSNSETFAPQACWNFLLNGECPLSRQGKTCTRSHDQKVVLDFARTQLPKMITIINKCVSNTMEKYVLHQIDKPCVASSRQSTMATHGSSFQPSHRNFNHLHDSEKKPSVRLLMRGSTSDTHEQGNKLSDGNHVEPSDLVDDKGGTDNL